jgi:hypothetical protein
MLERKVWYMCPFTRWNFVQRIWIYMHFQFPIKSIHTLIYTRIKRLVTWRKSGIDTSLLDLTWPGQTFLCNSSSSLHMKNCLLASAIRVTFFHVNGFQRVSSPSRDSYSEHGSVTYMVLNFLTLYSNTMVSWWHIFTCVRAAKLTFSVSLGYPSQVFSI